MKVAVILPAAGLGTRMGRTQPETGGTSRKQFMLLDGAPILVHTIRKFAASPLVGEIVIYLLALTVPGDNVVPPQRALAGVLMGVALRALMAFLTGSAIRLSQTQLGPPVAGFSLLLCQPPSQRRN